MNQPLAAKGRTRRRTGERKETNKEVINFKKYYNIFKYSKIQQKWDTSHILVATPASSSSSKEDGDVDAGDDVRP